MVVDSSTVDFRFLVGPPRGQTNCDMVASGINRYCSTSFVSSVACRNDGGDPAQFDLMFLDPSTCDTEAADLTSLARAAYVMPQSHNRSLVVLSCESMATLKHHVTRSRFFEASSRSMHFESSADLVCDQSHSVDQC